VIDTIQHTNLSTHNANKESYMEQKILKLIGLMLVAGSSQTFGAIADPVVADYGPVGGYISDISIPVARTTDNAPWFVTFELLQSSNVSIGAQGTSDDGGTFYLTSLRLTEYEDDTANIAFGTDSFETNPFEPNSIDQLLVADNLAPNRYALAVSGFGDTSQADFFTRLSVEPVPLPAAAWLFLSGIAGLFAVKKKQAIQ
jgi:hypothetical protein